MPFDASSYTLARSIRSEGATVPKPVRGNPLRWWRAPLWLLALLTGAKSFTDNPLLGSRGLNRAGLHVWRLTAAHRLAWWRRQRLAGRVTDELRKAFDRDGFVIVRDLLPPEQFKELRDVVFESAAECRSHRQGDTITTRIPVDAELLNRCPALFSLLRSSRWKGLMAYVASTRAEPLYYFQAIAGGVAEGPPDPQLELHADTFQPSLKAWLFLTDVPEDGRPLTYVAGSHRLTPQRVAWEKRRSIEIASADRLSQRGSLRIARDELAGLGLPQPTHFAVPANTLVAVDTAGFHARAWSDRPTMRVELWAYSRRSPFLPWTGLDPLSWRPIAIRRAEWLARSIDWLAARGLVIQQWRKSGPWNEAIKR